ncbi:MAG: hypothetical protein E7398_00085 [Ruminococcaceae bacterium]|nr:hypothetical protein [Oscillospiraceae bacterium]
MANWNFDATQYKEQDFQIIPAGDHRVRIEDVIERKFNSGNEGYEITLSVNGYNSKLWFYIVLDASNVERTNQRLGEFFNSFGITNTAMGTGKQWIGSVGAVRVKHEEYNNSTTAKVAYCINKSRQDKLPAWKTPINGTAPVSSNEFTPIDTPSDLPFEV